MLTLLKYEVLKKWNTFVLAILSLAIVEGVILYLLLYKEAWEASGFIFIYLAYGGLFFIFIDSALSFYNEFKNKSGYMLFLTPRSSYKIIGTKLIISFVEFAIGSAIFILLITVKYQLILNISNSSDNMFLILITDIIDVYVNDSYLFFNSLIILFFGWLTEISLVFLSISLANTILFNSKLKGLFSFVIFIIFSIINLKIINFVVEKTNLSLLDNYKIGIICSFIYLIIGIIYYLISSYVLNKKISM